MEIVLFWKDGAYINMRYHSQEELDKLYLDYGMPNKVVIRYGKIETSLYPERGT